MSSSNSDWSLNENAPECFATNTYFSSSVWGLEILFGVLNNRFGESKIEQKAAVNLPWPTVKVLYYFLGLHLATREQSMGRIVIPSGIVPQYPQERAEGSPLTEEIHQALRQHYERFIEENPEAK